MRPGFHPAVQPAAAPPQSRRPTGTGQEQAVPVRHLRQGLRHRIFTAHPHGQGNWSTLTHCEYFVVRETEKSQMGGRNGAGIEEDQWALWWVDRRPMIHRRVLSVGRRKGKKFNGKGGNGKNRSTPSTPWRRFFLSFLAHSFFFPFFRPTRVASFSPFFF